MVFSPALLRQTLIGILINIVVGFCLYGFITWLPTFFVRAGSTVVTSIQWTLVMSLGAPVGAVLGLYLADYTGRRATIAVVSIAAAGLGALFPHVGNGLPLMAVGFCLFTAIYILLTVAFAIYVPELFPTEIRMRGAGLCSTVGRLTTACVQYVIVLLFASGGLVAVVGTLSGLLLLLAVVMICFGVETAQKSLEAIANIPVGGDLSSPAVVVLSAEKADSGLDRLG